jgi:hypothetical protein
MVNIIFGVDNVTLAICSHRLQGGIVWKRDRKRGNRSIIRRPNV